MRECGGNGMRCLSPHWNASYDKPATYGVACHFEAPVPLPGRGPSVKRPEPSGSRCTRTSGRFRPNRFAIRATKCHASDERGEEQAGACGRCVAKQELRDEKRLPTKYRFAVRAGFAIMPLPLRRMGTHRGACRVRREDAEAEGGNLWAGALSPAKRRGRSRGARRPRPQWIQNRGAGRGGPAHTIRLQCVG